MEKYLMWFIMIFNCTFGLGGAVSSWSGNICVTKIIGYFKNMGKIFINGLRVI